MDCPVGTYQDSDFHKDSMCKNCSGTNIILSTKVVVGRDPGT